MIPKFRAWDVDLKTMYEVKSLVYTLKAVLGVNRAALYPERLLHWDTENMVIMQSTGSQDHLDNEIFDKDILLEPHTGHIVGHVFYSLECLAWKVGLLDGGEEYLTDCLDLEVCGNIYENPELVED